MKYKYIGRIFLTTILNITFFTSRFKRNLFFFITSGTFQREKDKFKEYYLKSEKDSWTVSVLVLTVSGLRFEYQ